MMRALKCVVRNLFFEYDYIDSTSGDGPLIFMVGMVSYDLILLTH